MNNSTAALYQVIDWNVNFEGAKSRTYSNKTTCQMPTKHGLGYKRLVRRKNGAALFGAWCALVQVLSRQRKDRYGYCTDTGKEDGKPYIPADLEMLTDIPAPIFAELFQIAAMQDVGWIRILRYHCADTTGSLNSDSNSNSDSDSNSNLNPNACIPESLAALEGWPAAWDGWLEMRKKARKAPTEHAKELMLAKLAERPQDAVAALGTCILSSWQGFEWAWIDKNKGKGGAPAQSVHRGHQEYIEPKMLFQ